MDFGATLTGRYISGVKEFPNGANAASAKMNGRFYTDIQGRWTPKFGPLSELGFAVGINNLFNIDPPGCITCSLNNFDPTTYDVPGRYYYARVAVKY
jgi:iron complex outermembrane receptor protein